MAMAAQFCDCMKCYLMAKMLNFMLGVFEYNNNNNKLTLAPYFLRIRLPSVIYKLGPSSPPPASCLAVPLQPFHLIKCSNCSPKSKGDYFPLEILARLLQCLVTVTGNHYHLLCVSPGKNSIQI